MRLGIRSIFRAIQGGISHAENPVSMNAYLPSIPFTVLTNAAAQLMLKNAA